MIHARKSCIAAHTSEDTNRCRGIYIVTKSQLILFDLGFSRFYSKEHSVREGLGFRVHVMKQFDCDVGIFTLPGSRTHAAPSRLFLTLGLAFHFTFLLKA